MDRFACTLLVLCTACGDPDCPDGFRFEDPRCVPVDAGTIDAGAGTDSGAPGDAGPGDGGGTTDAAPCSTTMCGGECLDTMTDTRHCGECDNDCGELVCIAGECVDAVVDLALGHYHSCALRASGAVVCWGSNESGQLGNAGMDQSSVPVAVVGIDDAVHLSAAGKYFRTNGGNTCVVRGDGSVWCWGRNDEGQLGNGMMGAMTFSNVPVRVSGIADAIGVAVGDIRACAWRRSGGVVCWGAGDLTPVPVAELSGVVQVEAGVAHHCARHEDGGVSCWGLNESGELGSGTAGDPPESATPIMVDGLPVPSLDMDVGVSHSCALLTSGEVHCWGSNFAGLLGTTLPPGDAARPEPAPVEGLTGALAIDGMFASTCALRSTGEIACWGMEAQESGAMGTLTEVRTARVVLGIETDRDVAVGNGHACAIVSDGGVACWGLNWSGKLGDGTTEHRQYPVSVVGLP